MNSVNVQRCALNHLMALLYYVKSDFIQVLLNVGFIILVAIVSLIFKRDDLGFQAFRAFDADDKSISYVHRPSVVSGSVNIFLSTFYAIVLSLIGNAWTGICASKRKSKGRDTRKAPNIELNQDSKLLQEREGINDDRPELLTPEQRVRMYRVVWGLFFLVIAIVETNLITNFTKTTMGVLKPHFLIECNPNQTMLDEISPNTWVNENMTLVICLNEAVDYRRSFPSGHASQAAVGVAYAYLEVNRLPNLLVSRVLQIVGVVYSVYIYTLRITNNQHNWYDVAAGAILGTLVAITAYLMKEKQVQRQFRVHGSYQSVNSCSDGETPGGKQRVVTDRETNVDSLHRDQEKPI